jgi:hypothetical protein
MVRVSVSRNLHQGSNLAFKKIEVLRLLGKDLPLQSEINKGFIGSLDSLLQALHESTLQPNEEIANGTDWFLWRNS